MSAALYNRIWKLQVGDVLIDGSDPDADQLAVEFSVRKSLRREPNQAEVTVFNLAHTTRDRITGQGESAAVILHAGYVQTGLEMIFSGDLHSSPGVWDGAQVATTLEGSDAGTAYRRARISRTYRGGTPVATVLSDAVDSLGVGRGNLPEFSSLALRNGQTSYPGPVVLHGWARDEVNRIVRSCGGTWSVQNGAFRLRMGRPATANALVMSPSTGLLGSPTREREQRRVIVRAEALLVPGAYPGRIVQLQSREIEGLYEIDRVEYVGATQGADWKVSLDLKEVGDG